MIVANIDSVLWRCHPTLSTQVPVQINENEATLIYACVETSTEFDFARSHESAVFEVTMGNIK